MQRTNGLIEKRKEFCHKYVCENSEKQIKVIVIELGERLFLSERTIWEIIKDRNCSGKPTIKI